MLSTDTEGLMIKKIILIFLLMLNLNPAFALEIELYINESGFLTLNDSIYCQTGCFFKYNERNKDYFVLRKVGSYEKGNLAIQHIDDISAKDYRFLLKRVENNKGFFKLSLNSNMIPSTLKYTTDGIQPEAGAAGWIAVIIALVQLIFDIFFDD